MTAVPGRSHHERSPLDVVVTVVLLLGFAVLAFVGGFYGALTGMVSDGCDAGSCDGDMIGAGVLTSILAFAIAFVVALVWSIKRFARRRTTWWVPLVCAVGGAVLWIVGLAISAAGAGL